MWSPFLFVSSGGKNPLHTRVRIAPAFQAVRFFYLALRLHNISGTFELYSALSAGQFEIRSV